MNLGRSKSTIPIKYERNKDRYSGLYTAIETHSKAKIRQKLASRKQRIIDSLNQASKKELYASLNALTSPEQTSKILAREHNQC